MALKRGPFILECDKCHERTELGTEDFNEAKELASEHKEQNGWMTVMSRGHYIDLCSDCT